MQDCWVGLLFTILFLFLIWSNYFSNKKIKKLNKSIESHREAIEALNKFSKNLEKLHKDDIKKFKSDISEVRSCCSDYDKKPQSEVRINTLIKKAIDDIKTDRYNFIQNQAKKREELKNKRNEKKS